MNLAEGHKGKVIFTVILIGLLTLAGAPNDPDSGVHLMSEWLVADKRGNPIKGFDITYTNQEGTKGTLKALLDRPVLLTFFYTRCQNNFKCSAAVTRIAALQTNLKATALQEKVRLLAITYEPEFDDAIRLKRFGKNRGLKFGADAQALRLDEKRHESFVKALNVPVSFNGGAVNTHGIALYLIDTSGRVVRQYHTILWDNDQVIKDVRRLLTELD